MRRQARFEQYAENRAREPPPSAPRLTYEEPLALPPADDVEMEYLDEEYNHPEL